MEGKHMVAHTSEIMGNGETLDKELKGVNNKIDNIKEDGTLIASKTKLGNVKIGDNIKVSDDGTISVPIASEAISGAVKARTIPYPEYSKYDEGYCMGIRDGKIVVRKATDTDLGAVKVGDGLNINNGVVSISNNQTLISILYDDISVDTVNDEITITNSTILDTIKNYVISNKSTKNLVICLNYELDTFNYYIAPMLHGVFPPTDLSAGLVFLLLNKYKLIIDENITSTYFKSTYLNIQN